MQYKIFETKIYIRDLEKLTKKGTSSLLEKKLHKKIYQQLRINPYFGVNIRKLRDFKPETWRYRTGNLRIFYSIDEKNKVVIMTALKLRKDAY